MSLSLYVFFFQAEDGIRDYKVTGVQTCALPISLNLDLRLRRRLAAVSHRRARHSDSIRRGTKNLRNFLRSQPRNRQNLDHLPLCFALPQIKGKQPDYCVESLYNDFSGIASQCPSPFPLRFLADRDPVT